MSGMAAVRERTPRDVKISAASTARWNSPEWLAVRSAARCRKIQEMLGKFPVTPQEAAELRALLPEPEAEPEQAASA